MDTCMQILKKCYLYKFPKKKKIKQGKKKALSRIQKYANKLNLDLPQSEHWFRSLFEKEQLNTLFFYNKPYGKYIPDVISYNYKIVIEVDGTIHDTEIQKFKDKIKDQYFIDRGYKVFRIKAYNINSYNETIEQIKLIIP